MLSPSPLGDTCNALFCLPPQLPPTLQPSVLTSSFSVFVCVDRNFSAIYMPPREPFLTTTERYVSAMSQLCAATYTRGSWSRVSIARPHSCSARSCMYVLHEPMRKLPLFVVFCGRAADKERISTFERSVTQQCIDRYNDRSHRFVPCTFSLEMIRPFRLYEIHFLITFK